MGDLRNLCLLAFAGTFKLELSWQPVDRLLGKNLEWAQLLAEQKNIHVTIVNTTFAREICSNNSGRVVELGLHDAAFPLLLSPLYE